MKWYLIKETGNEVETLVRLDRVFRVDARVTQEYVYVTLQMDNGQTISFAIAPDEYQPFLEKLGA